MIIRSVSILARDGSVGERFKSRCRKPNSELSLASGIIRSKVDQVRSHDVGDEVSTQVARQTSLFGADRAHDCIGGLSTVRLDPGAPVDQSHGEGKNIMRAVLGADIGRPKIAVRSGLQALPRRSAHWQRREFGRRRDDSEGRRRSQTAGGGGPGSLRAHAQGSEAVRARPRVGGRHDDPVAGGHRLLRRRWVARRGWSSAAGTNSVPSPVGNLMSSSEVRL